MTSQILVALRVRAAPERAFAAFTEEIGAWWRPHPAFAFTPREARGDPGRLSFEPGDDMSPGGRLIATYADGKVFEIGRVLEWAPPERLAFAWRQASLAPSQQTRVEVRFEAVGEETRVTVEHLGWDAVPAEHAARHGWPDALFLLRHGEWWRELLEGFASRIAGF